MLQDDEYLMREELGYAALAEARDTLSRKGYDVEYDDILFVWTDKDHRAYLCVSPAVDENLNYIPGYDCSRWTVDKEGECCAVGRMDYCADDSELLASVDGFAMLLEDVRNG